MYDDELKRGRMRIFEGNGWAKPGRTMDQSHMWHYVHEKRVKNQNTCHRSQRADERLT